MAEFTKLDEKLAEVLGLAQAAQEATDKVLEKAGEVGHREVLGELGNTAGDAKVEELVSWAHPIQDRHLNDVREFAKSVASDEDPAEAS